MGSALSPGRPPTQHQPCFPEAVPEPPSLLSMEHDCLAPPGTGHCSACCCQSCFNQEAIFFLKHKEDTKQFYFSFKSLFSTLTLKTFSLSD